MVNVTDVKLGTNVRKSFGKIKEVMPMPNLIQVQKDSYRWFIDIGLKEVLKDMSDITDLLDAAIKEAGIKTIVNLADSQEEAMAYPGFAESYYSSQNALYLGLGVDFQADDFQAGLADGLRHIAKNEGPYLVHCTEGKDRAGFVSALLSCLMGAGYEEVIADYMVTYDNYYGVKPGTDKYVAINDKYINYFLQNLFTF